MPQARSIPVALVEEGQRMASICNACRYCEGFCAVFPALERRLSFAEGDLAYLANLCHDCGSCYYACQYAPPHEFQVNFPKMLADIRMETRWLVCSNAMESPWPSLARRAWRCCCAPCSGS